MCARVAQWWSIALPRRGSRVRVPSRALKEIEKESSDGWLFFLCSSPAGLERFECLRAAPVVAVERLILALMKWLWVLPGLRCPYSIVDVNFLGAVLALRIAGSMDKDLLDKLMQDTWSQFRNFGSSIRYAREKDENGYFPCFASFNRLKKDLKAPSTSLRICWAMLEFSSR